MEPYCEGSGREGSEPQVCDVCAVCQFLCVRCVCVFLVIVLWKKGRLIDF